MPNKFKFKQYKLTDGKINSYNGFSYEKIETFDVPNTSSNNKKWPRLVKSVDDEQVDLNCKQLAGKSPEFLLIKKKQPPTMTL